MIRLTSFVFVAFVAFSEQFSFPKGIEKCSISDNDCILESTKNMILKYSQGYSDMNLVILDPLPLENFKFVKKDGAITIDYFTEFSHIYGMSNASIVKFNGFDKNVLEIEIKAPYLSFNGTYKAKAKLLGMSINGNGVYVGFYKNFDISMRFNLTRIEKEGKEFFKIQDSWMTFNFNESSINMPDLGQFANWLINASTQIILDALRDAMSEMWSLDFEEKLQQVFKTVPIDELFLK